MFSLLNRSNHTRQPRNGETVATRPSDRVGAASGIRTREISFAAPMKTSAKYPLPDDSGATWAFTRKVYGTDRASAPGGGLRLSLVKE